MAKTRRQSNEELESRLVDLEDGLPFAELVNDASGTITIPNNVETSFSFTSIPRQRGNKVSVAGDAINIQEAGQWKITFQARWATDVWTKYYVVDSSNAIVGESVTQGNTRDGNATTIFFTVTTPGIFKLTAYMTGGNTIVLPSFTGSPRGVTNRLIVCNLEKM